MKYLLLKRIASCELFKCRKNCLISNRKLALVLPYVNNTFPFIFKLLYSNQVKNKLKNPFSFYSALKKKNVGVKREPFWPTFLGKLPTTFCFLKCRSISFLYLFPSASVFFLCVTNSFLLPLFMNSVKFSPFIRVILIFLFYPYLSQFLSLLKNFPFV